jgi:Protein of unknown function (DUF3099)
MKQPQSITSLGESPEESRHRRMTQYFVAMGIRIVCIGLCLFVPWPWVLLPLLGAIVLPYIAVVLANMGSQNSSDEVLRPGSIVRNQDETGPTK